MGQRGAGPWPLRVCTEATLRSVLPDQCMMEGMWQLMGLLCMAALGWAQQYAGCPEPYGLQTYPHETYCDKFYKCENGRRQ